MKGTGKAQQVVDAARAAQPIKGPDLDQAFVDAVRVPMLRTWGQIAGDASQLEGWRPSQAGALELVLDANRMATYGGAEGVGADKLVSQACERHGWMKVAGFLNKHVRFSL